MASIRYDIQSVPEDDSQVRLIYCALSRYDDTWHSILHSHSQAELFYCVSGSGFLQIDGEKQPVREGDLFLINAAVPHTELSDDRGKLEYIVVGVSGVRFSLPEDSGLRYYLLDHSGNNREMLPYFQDILREVSRAREGYLPVCMRILDILLLKAGRHTQVQMAEDAGNGCANESAEVKRLMEERFFEPLTLDSLAAQVHISKYHLSRVFQSLYGTSPMRYLAGVRHREACHLLSHTDHSLQQIAVMAGFSSVSYFSQSFKRMEGMSPSSYRKQQRAGQEER